MTYEILEGDVLDVLRGLPDARYHATFFDPPYGLGTKEPTGEELVAYLTGSELDTGGDFMGADWHVPSVAVWKELRRVLRPGAYCASFAGSRTQDLITLGLRAGGFRIQDTMMWMHAEGAPKPFSTTDKLVDKRLGAKRERVRRVGRDGSERSDDGVGLRGNGDAGTEYDPEPTTEAAKLWSGHAHALAPAFEPVILAKKPSPLGLPETVLEYGTGALNIGECRTGGGSPRGTTTRLGQPAGDNGVLGGGRLPTDTVTTLGRWPKNVALVHSDECRPAGKRRIRGSHAGIPKAGELPAGVAFGSQKPYVGVSHVEADGLETVERWNCHQSCPVAMLDAQSGERPSTLTGRADPSKAHANGGDNAGTSAFGGGNSKVYADAGAASRFFFTAKPAECERDLGLDESHRRPGDKYRNSHRNVKPIAITEYMARLLRPAVPDAVLIIPYCGSGSEIIGALRAGWSHVIGIEREPHWAKVARARVERWEEALKSRPEFTVAEVLESGERVAAGQVGLFGGSR